MCSADYAGLLLAFQVFIRDELTARGFCQIQVGAWPAPQRAWTQLSVVVSETLSAQMNLEFEPGVRHPLAT